MRKFKYCFLIILIISLFNIQPLFAAETKSTTPEPYNKEEFPQALKDLRRFEIITLGSMPFVMLDCNLVYSGVLYAKGETTSYNPLDSSKYSTEQQVGLILTSLAISSGIGLTDFIVQKIKAGRIKKNIRKAKSNEINISPIENDPDAIKIQAPEENVIEDDELEDVLEDAE